MTPTLLATAAILVFWPGFGVAFTTPKLMALAIGAAIASVGLRERAPISPLWLVLLLWPAVTLFWVVDPLTRLWVLLWVFSIATIWSVRPLREDRRRVLEEAIGWAGLATVVYLALQLLGGDWIAFEPGWAAGSFFGNPNFAAHFLVLALCLGRFRGPFCWLGTAVIAVGIVLTGSKGGVAALFVWAMLRASWRLRAVSAVLVVLLISSAAWMFRSEVKEGLHWMVDPAAWSREHLEQPLLIAERDPWFRGKRASLVTRVILWGNTLAMIPEHGWVGVGAGDFRAAYPRHANARVADPNVNQIYRPASPHNWLLEAVVCLGIPWLVLLMVLLVRFYRQTANDRDWWVAFALQAGIGLFSLSYLEPVIPLLLIITAPGGVTVRRRPGWIAWPGALLVVILGVMADYRPDRREDVLFPENRARASLARGEVDAAWVAQIEAWRRDPFGPEVIYNLGAIAERRGETGLATELYSLVSATCPHYRPARERLDLLVGRDNSDDRIARSAIDLDARREALWRAVSDRLP